MYRDRQIRIGRQLHRFEAERQLAHNRVLEALGSLVVEPHVVLCPQTAERLALQREFADQLAEALVIRVAASLSAERRDNIARNLLPVGEELRRSRVQEDEAGGVRWVDDTVEKRRVERVAERVRCEHVSPT